MFAKIEFFSCNYNDLPPKIANELYLLRKKTFHTRLNWQVECIGKFERDQFDMADASYLLGTSEGKLICGARFIDTRVPTMISEIFHEYFEDLVLPTDIPCCEISRLFIDKNRRDEANLRGLPVSKALFLKMISYCIDRQYLGMFAIASRGMYAVFRQVGWKVEVIREGISEKGEAIYYIFMPANENIIEDIVRKDKNKAWLQQYQNARFNN